MEARISHSVVFDFDGVATVTEIANSLIAQERIFKDAVSIFCECFPGMQLDSVNIALREVTQQSPLREVFVGVIAASYGPELGEEVPDIVKSVLGIDVSDRYDAIISVLILVVAVYGFDWLVRRIYSIGKDGVAEKERKRLIGIVAKEMGISESQVEEAPGRALGKRQRSVIRSAIDFFRPARRLKARKIEVGRGKDEISREVLERFPSDAEIAQFEPKTDMQELKNVKITFRAHDLDKNEKWAATIEEVSSGRRPLHVAPYIDAKQLFDRREIIGDVIVTYIADEGGELRPKLYYLQRVIEEG